jgi:hypothetical protein
MRLGHRDEDRRQADHAAEKGDELGHLRHLAGPGSVRAGVAAQDTAEQHMAHAETDATGELGDQGGGRDDRDGHAAPGVSGQLPATPSAAFPAAMSTITEPGLIACSIASMRGGPGLILTTPERVNDTFAAYRQEE